MQIIIWFCLNLRQLSFTIEKKSTHRQTDTHTDTFWKTTFFHVLSVVQSESAIISNTIFLPSPYFHFLKEHGSKISVWRTIHDFHVLRFIFKIIFLSLIHIWYWELYNTGLYAKHHLILFEFAAVIVYHRKKLRCV